MQNPFPWANSPLRRRYAFASGILRMWIAFITPRSQDKDEARKEYITRVVLLVVSVVIIPFTLLAFVGFLLGASPIESILIMGGMSVLFPLGLLLTRWGYWRISRYFPIGMVLVSGLFGNYVGGIDAPAMVLYALALVLFGILVGTRGLFVGLAICLAGYLGFGLLHATALLPAPRTAADMFVNRVTIVLATLTTLALAVWFLIQQYQKALQLERERSAELSSLFEAITDGVVIIDLNGKVTELNPTLMSMFAFDESSQAIGMEGLDLVAAEERAAVRKRLEQTVLAGIGGRVDFRGIRTDGSHFHCEASLAPLRDAAGRIASVVAVVRDVTPQKVLQNTLQESEQRFRDLANLLPQAVYEIDKMGRLIYVNQWGLTGFGYPLGYPWEGFDMKKAVIPEDVPVIEAIFARVLSGETIEGDEFTGLRMDGSTFPIMGFASPVYRNGILEGARGILVDITERKRAEDKFRKLNEELDLRVQERTHDLELINQELESFSYSVSHDLRAPVRHIKGFAQLMEEESTKHLSSEEKEYLKKIKESADRMDALIISLLALGRVSKAELKMVEVDLSEIARSILAELQVAHPERKMLALVADNLRAKADHEYARTLLANLLDNAWKFTSPRMEGKIEMGKQEIDGECVFFIRDNGVGFDMTNAYKLFGPFQRLHTEGEFPGYGIGLATVRRIVNRHGGRIWVEAAVDKGATFYFTLPGTRVKTGKLSG